MRYRSLLPRLAVALVCAAVIGACSGSDSATPPKSKATTTTTTKAATVLLTGGEAVVASAGGDVPIDEATKQAVLDASQKYVDAAVLAPLVGGALGNDYAALFDAGVAAAATGVDRAALTDEGITPVTTSPTVTATPVRFDGLADGNGAVLLVATTFNLDVSGTTGTGPLTLHRTNELTFAPGPTGGWLITAYRVSVARDNGPGTTPTTAAAQS
jgi:hypothetical protein